jgi:hypothetical protein
MEVSTTQSAVSDFSPASSGDVLSLGMTEARRRTYLLLLIVGLALVLRLYGISLYPMEGDEYNSIAGARDINLNWNSIGYAVLTHFWIRLGDSEFWLRLPAAIFGTATVPILFKIGEKLGGWRTGLACGLLAATSPFSIYHSQEMRFYSLFILASAAFILATVGYLDGPGTLRSRAGVFLTGVFLVFSHFLGVLALGAQATAFVLANAKVSKRMRAVVLGTFAMLIGIPLVPFVQHSLWNFYSAHAGVNDFSRPVINGISAINFAKTAFAAYTFIFGYHVYPFRLGFVIPGSSVFGLLLCLGIMRLWQKSKWRMLPVTYLLALISVYFVLNSIGGQESSVIGPRHAAFIWPVFLILIAIGLTAFQNWHFHVLLGLVLAINMWSIGLGWQKDWNHSSAPDYRGAAAYASQWNTESAALLIAARSDGAIDFYFPKNMRLGDWYSYLLTDDLTPLLRNQRLIVVTDDWAADRRRGFDRLLERLNEHYTYVDGRVDYPVFEYVLERTSSERSGYSANGATHQLPQPLSIYGLEFQDLRLPVTVTAKDSTLKVIGAYGLPNLEGQNSMTVPLAQSTGASKLILVTNVIGLPGAQTGAAIAEVIVESKTGTLKVLPLRLGLETASWDERCQPSSNCETPFQWHKHMAIVGQNSFPGAWRDFQAGLHLVSFDLPAGTEVTRISIRYGAASGHLYLWGIGLRV